MTLYFVYANRKGDPGDRRTQLYFIADPRGFANSKKYNPVAMEYTGVAVEAESTYDAEKTYRRPTEGRGEVMWVDEPVQTWMKRQNLKKGVAKLEEHAMIVLTHRLAKLWELCDDAFRALATLLAAKDNGLTEEEAYDEIKRRFAARLAARPHHPPTEDFGEGLK